MLNYKKEMMMDAINIKTVKEQRDAFTKELTGYLLNDSLFVPVCDGNTHYQEVKKFIADGGTVEPAFSIDDLKRIKKGEIKKAFSASSVENVAVGTVTWNGGFESIGKINGAIQLAQALGQTTVTLYDAANTPHDLSVADAQSVVIELGKKYQSDFAKKQSLYAQIDAAATEQEIDAIVW